jgi:hypothetical protein
VLHTFDNGVCVDCEDHEPLDDDSAALLVALNELDGPLGEGSRAFDAAKHARNPKGSPGGGRFRSMVDRLKDAITEHQAGGGKGHPLDGFNREQLRRVAKARGIELKRGEDRDSIAAKLLDHLGGKPGGKPDFRERDLYDGLHVNGKPVEEAARGPLPTSTLDQRASRAAALWTDGYLAERWAKDLRGGYADGTLISSRGEQLDLADLTRDMDHAVSQGVIADDTQLWRGVVLHPDEVERLFRPGATFRDQSYLATSFRRTYAEQMLAYRMRDRGSGQQPYLMRILTPAGTPAAPGGQPVAEAVLGRNTPTRVVSIEAGNPGIITVEVVT